MRWLAIIGLAAMLYVVNEQRREATATAASRKGVIEKQAEQLDRVPVKETDTVTVVDETPTPADTIVWRTWKEAKEIAERENLPSLLHFTRGNTCLPCENLRLNVFTDQQVVDASKKFVCVKFLLCDNAADETAENIAALKAFGINREAGIPQNLFLLPGWSGAKTYIVPGQKMPRDAEAFTKYLNEWAEYLNTGGK